MAWQSVSMGLTSQGEVLNSDYWTNAPGDGVMMWAQFADGNITPTRGTLDFTSLEIGDTTNGLVLDGNNLHLYYNGIDSAYFSLQVSDYGTEYIIFFGIDEENQLGSVWLAQRRQVDRWGYSIAGGRLEAGGNTWKFYNSLDGYNWIKGLISPTYNWTSVPSVIGKNGTISLAQIASDSINDGEPVSDAAATAFSDLPAECNVGEIIDELLPYEESLVDVLVKYKVKGAVTGAFEYVKLVAKKGSIPKSVEDGDKVVDINPSKKSKLVTGLDEGSKYYFVIFVKDSADQTAKSNEMWIVTGESIIPPELQVYIDEINGSGFFFRDYADEADYGQGYVAQAVNYPFYNYSYFAYQDSVMVNLGIIPTSYDQSYDRTSYWLYQSQIIDLYIEKSGNNYSYSIDITNLNPAVNLWYGQTNNGIEFYDKPYQYERYWGGISSNLASSTFHSECTDSLENVLIHISQRFRNVNLYVDGVCWSKVSD